MRNRKDNRLTFTLQIDEEVDRMIKNLRDKYRINVSAICRDLIMDYHNRLEQTRK